MSPDFHNPQHKIILLKKETFLTLLRKLGIRKIALFSSIIEKTHLRFCSNVFMPCLLCSSLRRSVREEQGGRLCELPPVGGAGVRHCVWIQHVLVRQRQTLRPLGSPESDHAGVRDRGVSGGQEAGQASCHGTDKASGRGGNRDSHVTGTLAVAQEGSTRRASAYG